MAIRTTLRLLYLLYFSKPSSDRPIYLATVRRRVRTILELGFGTGRRAMRLIELARYANPGYPITYTAVDPFESRQPEDGPGLPLREAYRLLRATGARIHLVPGDPLEVFSSKANHLGAADLVLIGWPMDRSLLPRASHYLARLIHQESLVVLEERAQGAAEARLTVLSPERIRTWAASFNKAA